MNEWILNSEVFQLMPYKELKKTPLWTAKQTNKQKKRLF